MKQIHRLFLVALTAALLSACGGGNSDAPPPPAANEAVPPEASESSAGLVKYLTELFALSSDDKEPLDLSTFNPPKPEDTEPEPLS